jgi:hypothetical protein
MSYLAVGQFKNYVTLERGGGVVSLKRYFLLHRGGGWWFLRYITHKPDAILQPGLFLFAPVGTYYSGHGILATTDI